MIHLNKSKLLAINAALAVLAVAAVALPALLPLSTPAVKAPPRPCTQPAEATTQVQDLQAYTVIYLKPFSRPLADAPPPPPVAPPAPPPFVARLMGTVQEPGFAYAIFSLPDGHERLIALGETSDGICVKEIGEGCATVLYQGRTIPCKAVRQESPTPASGPYAPGMPLNRPLVPAAGGVR